MIELIEDRANIGKGGAITGVIDNSPLINI